MVLFLTSADASAANGGGSMLVMMIVLIAVFYFFMIRPENKRKKEAQAMRDAIKVGDNITTIGGIIGDVVSVKDDSIVIEDKLFGSCFETADQKEGMGAFLEKRKHEPYQNK